MRSADKLFLAVLVAWLGLAGLVKAQATQRVEREIAFTGAGDVKLVGSLMLPPPATKGRRVPAMLLVAGSGPTDRDGNQLPQMRTDILRQIASALATEGIGSFRFDKRVVGAAAKVMPMDRDGLGEYVRWENFVTDTTKAFAALRQHPQIDSTRCGLLGHSEGGLLILSALDQLKQGDQPKAMVLIATPGRPIDQVIVEQVGSLLKRQNASPQQTTFFIDQTKRIIQAIRTSGQVPADVPPGLAALFPAYIGKFLQSEFALDPAAQVTHFGGPVLVVNGASDIQISAEQDSTKLQAALKARPGGQQQLLILGGLSHNLKPTTGSADAGIAGDVPADAMGRIVGWINSTLNSN